MISTFIRIWAEDDLRLGMAISTVARWQMDKLADLTLVMCEKSLFHPSWKNLKSVIIPEENFSQKSIRAIENLAYGDFYSASDDDMLIYGGDFLRRCVEVLERNSEYGIICASPTNEGKIQLAASAFQDFPEVIESHAVGGPGLIRRGIMKGFPPITNNQYAGWIDQQYRSQGWKMGYMRDLEYLHLGSRFSFSSPPHFTGA